MDSNLRQRDSEIEEFLCDVREHFKASLETSEYENTSNLFHVTEAEATARLLHRCELLLQQYTNSKKPQQEQQPDSINNNNNSNNNNNNNNNNSNVQSHINGAGAGANVSQKLNALSHSSLQEHRDEASYLDMTGHSKKMSTSTEYMDFNGSTSNVSDKTFRCSTRLAGDCQEINFNLERNNNNNNNNQSTQDDDSFDEETQIYDICQVSQVDIDTLQKSCLTSHENDSNANDCPYINLPAGHLSIQKSTKYGQLQRIEKRLFFDQSKKCYCGILNDWLLCYADGPTASRPTLTLHLRTPGIEIEHSGDGKRREICFQITMGDPNKKFIFQANNEVDAKEWIHAIETAIRSDTKQPRKLPTPPLMKKITFINKVSRCNANGSQNSIISGNQINQNDYIYEEPSPLYDAQHTPNEQLIIKSPPDLPAKLNDPASIAKRYEYDIPKCPAQPIAPLISDSNKNNPDEIETIGLLNVESEDNSMISGTSSGTGIGTGIGKSASSSNSIKNDEIEKVDFQTMVKDLHNKLSSQLLTVASASALASSLSPHSSDRMLKKTARKTYSNSSNESEAISLTTSPTAKDQKKQKKSNTPNGSPQKSNNNNNFNNNNNNNNNTVEKSAKNWFLNRLNKTTNSVRSSGIGIAPSTTKCRQSEKENLLNSLDLTENFDCSSSPSSPILKSPGNNSSSNCSSSTNNNNKSKVNMIINQFEASGGHLAMFSMEAMANFTAVFSDNNDCNNYEPIMSISVATPSSLLKKV